MGDEDLYVVNCIVPMFIMIMIHVRYILQFYQFSHYDCTSQSLISLNVFIPTFV